MCVLAYENKSSERLQYLELSLLGLKRKDADNNDTILIHRVHNLREEIVVDEALDPEITRKNLPQFVNFSLRSGPYPILLVFMRIPHHFYVFTVESGALLKLGVQYLDLLKNKANVYLDDGCIIDNQIVLSLQCNTIISIAFRV